MESDDNQHRQLIYAAQAGDNAAFGELVTVYRDRVYAIVYQMVNSEADAWDFSQEVFIRAWKALPRYEARASFATWLFRIAHNVVYDHFRSKKNRANVEFDEALLTNVDPHATTGNRAPAPDEALANSELGARIHAALQQLGDEQREVVILKEIQGLSYRQIADVTNASEGTVMSRLFYARKKLQQLLSDEHYEHGN